MALKLAKSCTPTTVIFRQIGTVNFTSSTAVTFHFEFMTNLLLATALAMSPKLASQQPQHANVQVSTPPPITVTIAGQNTSPPSTLASNLFAITPPASPTVYMAIPAPSKFATFRAQITAPSNSVIAIAAIGLNGLQSAFSSPVTNQAPTPPAPLTNIQYVIPCFSTDLLNWQRETNMAWRWTTPGYWRLLTSTNL